MALLSDCWGNLPVPPDPFPWSAIADGRLAPHVSLVFAAIAPHGTLPEAPVAGADATHAALAELGRRFDAARPEATIVLTPHNVHVQGHFAVVLAGTLTGSLEDFDAPEVRLSSPVDLELATQAIVALHDDGIPVVAASFGANDPAAATAPMDWGVLIPLWVMGGRADPPPPVVVVSPARDRSREEHVRAGRALARLIEGSPQARRADRKRRSRPRARRRWSVRIRPRGRRVRRLRGRARQGEPSGRPARPRRVLRGRRQGGQLVATPDAARSVGGRLARGVSELRSINLFRDALCRLCT
ncbi:MAG: hypothetical protein E6G36_13045 [Actinobacteria bacterium]|nr:MAG: hypothetical protein E6G36_13045 [Actinomycetota bacterium]